jgi:hypothetical protein
MSESEYPYNERAEGCILISLVFIGLFVWYMLYSMNEHDVNRFNCLNMVGSHVIHNSTGDTLYVYDQSNQNLRIRTELYGSFTVKAHEVRRIHPKQNCNERHQYVR